MSIDLEAFAHEHVSYELDQLGAMALRPTPPTDTVLGNAVLEAFLVHARLLHEFLAREPVFPDDVRAATFLPTWLGEEALTKPQLDNINKRIMHLSGMRSRQFSWQRGVVARRVIKTFGRFLGELDAGPHPERAGWFRPAYERARELVKVG
jgi:hypothetical protein